jgi:hypothetical protein
MPEIHSPVVFWLAAGALVAYVLFLMIRRRKGERPGVATREPDL